MKISTDLRLLYTPYQPTVSQTGDKVTYTEFLPHHGLQNFIYCYWELKTKQVLSEEFNYRVVADGCIDIFFDINNPGDNFVMGFCKKFTSFSLPNSFHYAGIRFLPTMFPQIFKVKASELSNRFEMLGLVAPATSRFITDNVNNTLIIPEINKIFDQYFLQLILQTDFVDDTRLYGAIKTILKNFGLVNIEKDLNTGISPRQLRRLFEFYIGDTAKTFSKVVRFQNILRAKPSVQSLRENKLFFNQGYYDQAHFIKEFKNCYGVTPTRAFGR